MKTAYLGLGSNLGDRLGTLRKAVEQLHKDPAIRLGKISSVYATKPVGVVDQPDFLNLVMEIETAHTPAELLTATQRIEHALGRVRQERWGARTIDLDLLWFEGVRSDDARLTLPHPRAKERSFVLIPWAEIAPQLKLEGESLATLANRVGAEGMQKVGAWSHDGEAR